MPWDEFCTLVAGLMPETPLGKIVAIRSEKDYKVIKDFTPDQRRIYNDWQTKKSKSKLQNKEKLDQDMKMLSKALANAFGKGVK